MTRADIDSVTYTVHEHFWSIQGEGANAGRSAYFIRLQGCPVGCEWCDAKLTWFAGGTKMTVAALRAAVIAKRPDLVVITGGEPCLYDLDPLIAMTATLGIASQLETSGAYPLKGTLFPDYITVSPKHRRDYAVDPALHREAFEMKYVVDDHLTDDVIQAHRLQSIAIFNARERGMTVGATSALPHIYVMPEGAPPTATTIMAALQLIERNPYYRFGPRLQYAYPQIADMEGDTNKIISAEDAKAASKEYVHGKNTRASASNV